MKINVQQMLMKLPVYFLRDATIILHYIKGSYIQNCTLLSELLTDNEV